MYVVSSVDEMQGWSFETKISIGADLREPRFLVIGGELFLYYFEAGTSMVSFTPKNMWRTQRRPDGTWTEPVTFGRPEAVPWDIKLRGGVGYMTSDAGNHYTASPESTIEVYFEKTLNGIDWSPVDPQQVVSYRGGVSEVAFEFDEDGSAWFVTRNEDGDATGFGSHVCRAEAPKLADWDCPDRSDPERYDSPELFRHGNKLYLVARRDIGGPFDQGRDIPLSQARLQYALDYWTRPKRTAIYRVDKQARKIVHLLDLPSAGDTAFASVHRTGAHTFLVANYTSPLDRPDISWSEGQGSSRGTQIYFVTLSFTPDL